MESRRKDQEPVKDKDAAHPVPCAWRSVLSDIVRAFVRGDFALEQGICSVLPPTAATVRQVGAYVAAYGESLSELPDQTWETSVAQWMETYWDVIVDLYTAESGKSDLVLFVRVFEAADGFRYEIDSVHVP